MSALVFERWCGAALLLVSVLMVAVVVLIERRTARRRTMNARTARALADFVIFDAELRGRRRERGAS